MPALDAARRAEIGAARRARTREALIEGALETVTETPLDELTIDDFIAAAGVARGTFYNHFRTKEALLTAMADHVADAVDAELDRLLDGETDPVRRLPIAIREFIALCAERPAWGWVLVQSTPSAPGGWSDYMRQGLRGDIRRGIAAGAFRVPDEEVAVAMAFGSLREGIRLAAGGGTPAGFAEALTAITLQALGLSPEDAKRAAAV